MEQNEILEETRRTNELLRGQLLWMRAAAALLAVLLAAVVVCLGNTMNSMAASPRRWKAWIWPLWPSRSRSSIWTP